MPIPSDAGNVSTPDLGKTTQVGRAKRPQSMKERRRLSAKIAILINEGMPRDQAVAVAHDMLRKGSI